MTEGVSVYVCVLDEEGSWVLASRALVVVWTAVYLTGYWDIIWPVLWATFTVLQTPHQFEYLVRSLGQTAVSL